MLKGEKKMTHCHKCLKKIHFWESRVKGSHIKCLSVERRCKYYHIQRDMHTSLLFALFVCLSIIFFTNSIIGHYIAVIAGIFIFLFSSIIADGIRKREEEERKNV